MTFKSHLLIHNPLPYLFTFRQDVRKIRGFPTAARLTSYIGETKRVTVKAAKTVTSFTSAVSVASLD